MEFKTNAAPYVRSKKSTLQIMIALCIALAIVWAFGIVYSFKLDSTIKEVGAIKEATNYGIKAILNVVVAVVVSILCDVVISLIKQAKKGAIDFKEIVSDFLHNYSYVSGMIFALTLPVYASLYVVIIGSLFATLICKNVFGGFGKNVFNPAIMARIFVGLCFGAALGTPDAILKTAIKAKEAFAVDAISGATLTTSYNNVSGWLSTNLSGNVVVIENTLLSGFTTKDLLLGNYLGALGETFTLVILVLGIVLSVLKVINWRTPVFYLGTVILSAVLIALFGNMNVGLYVLAHLSLGGLMFGAVFMLTDPVTGPSSNLGKIIAAIFAGFMTVLIRVKGGYPEGVMYSIAMANLISPFIDTLIKGRTNEHSGRKIGILAGSMAVVVLVLGLLGGSLVEHKSITNDYGINYAEEEKLNSFYELGENEHFEKVNISQVNTEVTFGYSFTNKEKNEELKTALKQDKLAKAYLVKDGDTIKAYAYVVAATDDIQTAEGFSSKVTGTAFVVIGADGKLLSISFVNPTGPCTDTGFFGRIGGVTEAFIGLDKTGAANAVGEDETKPDTFSGMTYSPKIIKKILANAFEQFEADTAK